MTNWVTTSHLATLLNLSYDAVNKALQRGTYAVIKQKGGNGVGRGGKIWLININDPAIPETARQKYYTSLVPNLQPTNGDGNAVFFITACGAGPIPAPPVKPPNRLPERAGTGLPAPTLTPIVPDKLKTIALARLDLVTTWQEYRQRNASPKDRLKTDEEFEKAYNMNLLAPCVYQILGSVDIHSIKRWYRRLEGSCDWTRLVPRWCCEKREPTLSTEEKKVFEECLLNPNRLSIGEATRITKAVLFKRDIPSLSAPITFRRWAEWFKDKNSHIWTFMRDGDKALKDKEIFSIQRDASKLEVGDVLVADGHRLNFQVINPFTGKPCRATLVGYLDWKSWNLAGYEIMVEENVQTIAAALRSAVIRLGRTPKIAYQDNGKAFRAKFFTESIDFEEAGFNGLFGKLGIKAVFTMKYNAKAKPVERFWKEFTGKFERLLPSFTGACIDDKPAYMKMGETFHRACHNGYIPTIQETTEMLDTWIRDYLEIQPCPHVKGKTIGEVFREGQGSGVNIDELDELMMATEIKTIRANGIRFLGADYYDDALFGLRESVFIKYALSDLSYIRIYDREGRFLGTAKRVLPVHPMAQLLGDAKDVAEVRHLQNKQRSLQKAVVKAAKEIISQNKVLPPWADIIPMTPRTIDQIERAKPALLEPEEVHIPDAALKGNTQQETFLNTTVTGSELHDVPERPERPWQWNDIYERGEWHLKYGCDTEDDRAILEEFKRTNYYRMTHMTQEQQEATRHLFCR